MHLKLTITFAAIVAIVLATGCGSTKQKKSTLPAISADNTPFIRITDRAYIDLFVAAVKGKTTPTREVVESEIKRQRVFGTESLDKGDLYIPGLVNNTDPQSIVTVDSGVDDWVLIRTAVWVESRKDAVMVAGFIPFNEYKRGTLRKAVHSK